MVVMMRWIVKMMLSMTMVELIMIMVTMIVLVPKTRFECDGRMCPGKIDHDDDKHDDHDIDDGNDTDDCTCTVG